MSIAFICRTCGVQYQPSNDPPPRCIICEDPRQYVGWTGQSWTTLDELQREGYRTEIRTLERDLLGIGVTPQLAIGQRALMVRTPNGNVLWDIPGYVDTQAFEQVEQMGRLVAISASHPHFYGVMAEWARALDAPIVLPKTDAKWVTRSDVEVRFYNDTKEVVPGVTLVRCGGHFEGSAILHWANGAGGKGVLLSGDTITVVQDREHVSFMWSYPNYIPLSAATVNGIIQRIDQYAFDRIYGGWWGRVLAANASEAVRRSAQRYVRSIGG